jgi:anti-sigma regulatory factor (Ser/Thr protein kinase)
VILELAGRHPLLRADLTPERRADQVVTIDATRLRFISPLDLTAVAAIAHTTAVTSGKSVLRLPSDPRVTSYLQRMDLLAQLPESTIAVGAVPFDVRSDHHATLLETTLLTPETAPDVSERIGLLALANLGASPGARVARSVGELIDNAVSHGHGQAGAYIAAQAYTGKTTGTRRLEVAICDNGIGVLAHLRRNPDHAGLTDSETALRQALQPGISGTRDSRGNGLPDLLRQAGTTGPTRLVVRSGSGLVRAARHRTGMRTVSTLAAAMPIQGTWAWLRVSFAP